MRVECKSSRFKAAVVMRSTRDAVRLLTHSVGAIMIATALVTFLLGPVLKAYQVDCRSGTPGAIGTKGWLDYANVRHLTVSIPAEWENTAVGDRVSAAIAAWNNESAISSVVLHPSFGTGGDVEFRMMSGTGNPSCANYNPADDRVSLHPDLVAASANLPAQVEYVIRHEIGHVVGLAHASQADSAMFAPSYPACSSVHIDNFPTHGISFYDYLSASDCAALLSQHVYGSGGSVEYDFNGTCWDYYLVTTYYAWDAGLQTWTVVGQTWEYLYTSCEPIIY